MFSSVRLLLSSSGTRTAILLRFTSSRVSDQHRSIVRSEYFFNFTFGLFIDKLLIESNNTFANSLTNSIDLGSITTTSNSNSDIEARESLGTQQQEGFLDFSSHGLHYKNTYGWMVSKGQPFTLRSPLPCLTVATATAVLFLPKHCTSSTLLLLIRYL